MNEDIYLDSLDGFQIIDPHNSFDDEEWWVDDWEDHFDDDFDDDWEDDWDDDFDDHDLDWDDEP